MSADLLNSSSFSFFVLRFFHDRSLELGQDEAELGLNARKDGHGNFVSTNVVWVSRFVHLGHASRNNSLASSRLAERVVKLKLF
jgi:hypothetical protein